MDFQTFKILVSKWAAEKVFPAISPEGPVRWLFAFAGMGRVQALIEQYAPQFVIMTADGKVDMALTGAIREKTHWLPRFGFEFAMPGENKAFTYYGYGPGETYCDLHRYAAVSMYDSDVDAAYVLAYEAIAYPGQTETE
jgi:hypothetical protein